jgi:hypothetical protein
MEWSTTQTLDYSNVAKWLSVASPLVYIRCPQQVRSVTNFYIATNLLRSIQVTLSDVTFGLVGLR